MALSYLSLFLSWYLAISSHWKYSFDVLYIGVVGIACGSYVVAEVVYILKNNWNGFGNTPPISNTVVFSFTWLRFGEK